MPDKVFQSRQEIAWEDDGSGKDTFDVKRDK